MMMAETAMERFLRNVRKDKVTKRDVKKVEQAVDGLKEMVEELCKEIKLMNKRLVKIEDRLVKVEDSMIVLEKKVDKNTVMLKDMGDTFHDLTKIVVTKEEFEMVKKRTGRIEEHLELPIVGV